MPILADIVTSSFQAEKGYLNKLTFILFQIIIKQIIQGKFATLHIVIVDSFTNTHVKYRSSLS